MSRSHEASQHVSPAGNRGLVLFTTLAMNQTRFFAALDRALTQRGYNVAHICFHERSHEYLSAAGLVSYNVYDTHGGDPAHVDLSRYGGDRLNLLLSHEKAAFEIADSRQLTEKYRRYLSAAEVIFDDLEKRKPPRIWLVQELGGFLSLMAAYHVARERGIDNVFIEPSFFRGRVFFVRNSLAALPVHGPDETPASREVSGYLARTLEQQQVVIPTKDWRHYRTAGKKLGDPYNIRRFAEKFVDKYLLRKREEFQFIGGHVQRHIRMFVKSQVLRMHYRRLMPGQRYVYYPLHVPADFALTIRSPEYLDQYALIDYIARVVPSTHVVAIKEHPALVGAVEWRRTRDLLKRRDNIVLLDPRMNNYMVMKSADAVLTVNSKSGAEALLLGKKVLVLGDAFYRPCRLAEAVGKLVDIPSILSRALTDTSTQPTGPVQSYFQNVWDRSSPGELYDITAANIGCFAESLLRYMRND